ncbi:SAC domain-containing protein [Sarcoptes scabiei]|uniref:SAC domain-containing protein n=1 Tax=Sarcoptes scabiei TaxID=52283 RepID=A0A132A1I6_SARSC|nr:SAC domain-containing protein [Sarcoptes scabiei]
MNEPEPKAKMKNNESFCIEKILCYIFKNFLYIIGSSNCKRKHRVMKIDRRKARELIIQFEDTVYTTDELNAYRIQEGFDHSKKIQTIVAFGIVGFVRFMEGYYLILIVKRRCIALIGAHCIYKIEDTKMVYVPNEEKTILDEMKCLKVFANVDLKSDFYFSYSYDLSNTIQYNLMSDRSEEHRNLVYGFGTPNTAWERNCSPTIESEIVSFRQSDRNIYINPNMKFVWNEFLLEPMNDVHNDFFLYICYGFVGQVALPIEGRNLMLTLIARRSKKYAGTRYLKRGVNCDGYSANEVETEQIVHDGNISSFRHGLFSSYVQVRGSVPIYWSQNIAKMTPKPSINIDINDPFFEAAGKHFNHLMHQYGSPIIVFNLVKRKEKHLQESILYNEFESLIEYLNQFIPRKHHIMLVGYDMAKSKKQNDNVINYLAIIANYLMKKTGFFQNRLFTIEQNICCDIANNHRACDNGGSKSIRSLHQTGIIRVNCVDCLDRTNTAQCVIGTVALSYQLYSMGVLNEPELSFDSGCVQLLEELYEDHGDTLALQYGGSQLVHRMKTYRRSAPITTQSKDIMQSLSRYYSNAFEDWNKQTAINMFLGIYDKNQNCPLITEVSTDYELHHQFYGENLKIITDKYEAYEKKLSIEQNYNRLTKWWSDKVAITLPRAAKEIFKFQSENFDDDQDHYHHRFIKRIINYDWFFDVHRLQENTVLSETFLFNMKRLKCLGSFAKKTSQTYWTKSIRTNLIDTIKRDNSDAFAESDRDEKIIIRFENNYKNFVLKNIPEYLIEDRFKTKKSTKKMNSTKIFRTPSSSTSFSSLESSLMRSKKSFQSSRIVSPSSSSSLILSNVLKSTTSNKRYLQQEWINNREYYRHYFDNLNRINQNNRFESNVSYRIYSLTLKRIQSMRNPLSSDNLNKYRNYLRLKNFYNDL